MPLNNNLLFRQLFDLESFTYTYLLADKATLEAIIIDPVLEQVERDLEIIKELDLKVKYILDTHIHADHITSSSRLRERLKAQIVLGKAAGANCADILIDDGAKLRFGAFEIMAISTPGHTSGCTSYQVENMLFTGDTLLIRGCGRTDFQQGSAEKLYHSVREKLFKFPDETLVYPAHDYKGRLVSSIGEEKQFNPRLKLEHSQAEFVEIMHKLHLPEPKKIKESLPRNMSCGS